MTPVCLMGELVWLQIDHGQPVGEGAEASTDWYQSLEALEDG